MTTQTDKIKILISYLDTLKDSSNTLQHSLKQCEPLLDKSHYSIEDLDKLEALTSRYSRVSDILIQKVFRAIDQIELVAEGSIIDSINRAAKRKLISSTDDFINIRELRNTISHEYKEEGLNEIFKICIRYTPKVLLSIENTFKYCKEKYETL
ncbi:MAG: hypothetical protein HOO06_06210 [Bdellovibrionaceae bacterium]|jgi:hypothetical protein|nr:hypothetical protein [Pseudobdellovibrionaceae bacterium]